MNNFGSYLLSHQLAKGHLQVAEDRLRRGLPYGKVIEPLLEAVRSQQVASANLCQWVKTIQSKKRGIKK
jgi:hypothetical protein